MPAPAPTELLDQDINRLASAIDNLAAKFDDNNKYQRDFNFDVTKQLGQINTRMESLNTDITKQLGAINTRIGSITTTLRIAGAIVTLFAGVVLTLGLSSYQTMWAAGKREGILETKIDIMKSQFDDLLKGLNRASGDRSTPPTRNEDEESMRPRPKTKIGPSVVPSADNHSAELKKMTPDAHSNSPSSNPTSSPCPGGDKPTGTRSP